MGTGQKMGTSFPKGVKKFVDGYRVKEIRQLVQGEIVNRIYNKNDRFYNNLWQYKSGQKVLKKFVKNKNLNNEERC